MSIRDGKVRLYIRKHSNVLIVRSLLGVQFILTMILSVSLAAHIIWPENAKGATPSPLQISYEGRLTDSSGNALGGTGSMYCYKFSIYDSPTGGNKLWPATAPSVTTATTTDGVFSAIIGQSDTLTSTIFDFSTTSTAYLQVDVGTTSPTCATGLVESLSPRQQINASPYALSANSLGSYVTADMPNGRARVGTAAGLATPVYLGLDWKNTNLNTDSVGQNCPTNAVNGTMWYNSNASISRAFVCEAGIIQAISNSGATTSISGITANGVATAASTGTVNFNNGNGVTFGVNGNTITASVAAAGGATMSWFENMPNAIFTATSLMVNSKSSSYVFPFVLPQAISVSYVRMPASFSLVSTSFASAAVPWSSTFNEAGTYNVQVFSQNVGANSLSLAQVASGSAGWTYSVSVTGANATNNWTVSESLTYPSRGAILNTAANTAQTASTISVLTSLFSQFTGWRYLDIPFATSLSAGNYWMVIGQAVTTGGANIGLNISNIAISQTNQAIGNLGSATNASQQLQMGLGSWTTNAQVTTASIGLSSISSVASQPRPYFQFIRQN